jgi:type IV pilus biogenesis protein CpaD/CtpE
VGAIDRQTLLMRRLIAAGVGVVLLIVIVLIINGCLKSHKEQALKSYNTNVGQIIGESDQQVSHPLFAALAGASGKAPLQVVGQINPLIHEAESQAARARGLSVPGEMTAAQSDLLLALDLRTEGVTKVAAKISTALGSHNKQTITEIAGDMESFLASDVIYSQRVAPLIQQTLSAAGISEQTPTTSNFLPNLGWLEPNTVTARLTGTGSSSSASGQIAPGTHGHAVTGVSIGSTSLQAAPTVNHVSGGANPTFTVNVENGGSNPETNVKVEVTVTSGGKQVKGMHVINKTEPGQTYPVDIAVEGVTLKAASSVVAYVQPVPGETNIENNKGTYDVVFE